VAAEEYLTIEEVAVRLKISPKTIRNKMASGLFTKGTHYFRRKGLSARFKWTAVVQWLEAGHNEAKPSADAIPMARGYSLGKPNSQAS
jgi:hypothetical protein